MQGGGRGGRRRSSPLTDATRLARAAGLALLLAAACGGDEPADRLGPDGMLEVDGAQLWYGTVGSGAPLILLHGGPGLGQVYLLANLDAPGFPPEGMRIVAYDQRGSGRSTGAEEPDSIYMDRFVRDLEAVRRATGQERVALLGHSFGGLLAMHYAVRHPERVAGMILLDPDPASRVLWERHREIVASRTTRADSLAMAAISSSEGWEIDPVNLERHTLIGLQAYFGEREAAQALRLGLERNVYGNFPGTAELMRERLGDWDLFDELGSVQAPTLIVTGTESIFPMEAHERLADALPDAELVVLEGVGHFPHMEDKEGFGRAVGAFLAEITGEVGGGP